MVDSANKDPLGALFDSPLPAERTAIANENHGGT
jgi:hypothetical protein